MKIGIEGANLTTAELSQFNPVGEENWRNEFFNKDFSNSFLVTARSEQGVLIGTQGFMEYKVNYFGEMRLCFRSERTLLSSECRGKGIFKKQVELGKAEMLNRGGVLCFGSTEAVKAFEAAGFKGFNGYRAYELKMFSLFKTSNLSIKIIISYLKNKIPRLVNREFIIVDLYNFVIIKSLFSYANPMNIFNFFQDLRLQNGLKVEVDLTEFKTNNTDFTDAVSQHFNIRKNAIYLWTDADFFLRLSLNYPVLHYLKIKISDDSVCHAILERMHSGVYKVVMCSDYDVFKRATKLNKKYFTAANVYGLMTVRSKYRVSKQELYQKTLGSSRLNGFGSLVLMDYMNFSMKDFEMEEIWLML